MSEPTPAPVPSDDDVVRNDEPKELEPTLQGTQSSPAEGDVSPAQCGDVPSPKKLSLDGVAVLGIVLVSGVAMIAPCTILRPCVGATRSARLKWTERQAEIEQAAWDAKEDVEP